MPSGNSVGVIALFILKRRGNNIEEERIDRGA